jgi:hypothetical protein
VITTLNAEHAEHAEFKVHHASLRDVVESPVAFLRACIKTLIREPLVFVATFE